jgi:hypothetical protein
MSLPKSTSFNILVPKGISSSLYNDLLEADFAFQFSTPTASILSSYPEHNAIVSLSPVFFIGFDQAIDKGTQAAL